MAKTVAAIIVVMVFGGCADLPTVKACGQIEYKRVGMEYEFHATKCRIMVDDSVLGAAVGVVK